MNQGYVLPLWLKNALEIKFGPGIGINHVVVFLLEAECRRIDKLGLTEDQKVEHALNVLCGKIVKMEKKNDDSGKARKNVRKSKQTPPTNPNNG
jgi:Zn ribbon nucleic-acid-binding protein